MGDGVVQGVVARLTGLQSLSLAGAAVSDAGVWALTALTNLTALDLSWASTVTNDGVAALAALSGLQMLNLAYLFRLTDEGLAPLAGLKALRALNLRGVTHVGAEGRAHVKHVKHIVTGVRSRCCRKRAGLHNRSVEGNCTAGVSYVLVADGSRGARLCFGCPRSLNKPFKRR